MNIDQYNFANKKALIRVDFNVPLDENFEITDFKRIEAAKPTLEKILKDGGSLILMSHLGRPKGQYNEKYSLSHIVYGIEKVLGLNVKFVNDCIGEVVKQMVSDLKPGEVLLLENLRFYKEEEQGDREFAAKLAGLGDVFVNDAFGTAHRAHASTSVVADFFAEDKLFGYLMAAEINNADKVLNNSEKPLTAIMGGAKVSDKILLIENLLDKVDNIIIGGGMAYTFVYATGGKIGKSLLESDRVDLCLSILEKAKEKGVNLLLPIDSKIADRFDNQADQAFSEIDEIPDDWMGLDIGPKTIELFNSCILNSKTILWNGPMGVFEFSSFQDGTKAIADSLVEATKNGAFTLVGGGDSAAAISKFELKDQVSYVSTGGGALLEYMEGKVLPGVKAIIG